jgi:hypothetical protein
MERDAEPAEPAPNRRDRDTNDGSPELRPATPARVWLSRLGTGQGEIEGTLGLTATHLRFDHRRGTLHEHIPLDAIRKVKRPLGSPLVLVEYVRDDHPVRVVFFFAQPPPFDQTSSSQMRGRRTRSDNAGYMWQQSGNVAVLARSWRDAIRRAAKRARTAD